MSSALNLLVAAYQSGSKLLVCGNGGSAADSDHIVGELMKGFLKRRPISAEHATQLEQAGGAAGKDIANPIGSILSVAMMLDHFQLNEEARTVRAAVEWTLASRF